MRTRALFEIGLYSWTPNTWKICVKRCVIVVHTLSLVYLVVPFLLALTLLQSHTEWCQTVVGTTERSISRVSSIEYLTPPNADRAGLFCTYTTSNIYLFYSLIQWHKNIFDVGQCLLEGKGAVVVCQPGKNSDVSHMFGCCWSGSFELYSTKYQAAHVHNDLTTSDPFLKWSRRIKKKRKKKESDNKENYVH